jgi:hypothetical protein
MNSDLMPVLIELTAIYTKAVLTISTVASYAMHDAIFV